MFSTVNRIFKAAAGKRQSAELQIATYTVVPLSPASGVLEWVVSVQQASDADADLFMPS